MSVKAQLFPSDRHCKQQRAAMSQDPLQFPSSNEVALRIDDVSVPSQAYVFHT